MEISVDISQDGTGAMTVDASNVTTIEFKKPLNSGDSDGKDIAWHESDTYTLILMWNSNLNGASGGNVTHTEGSIDDKNMFLASTTIPEFSGLLFAVLLVAMTISVFVLNRKIKSKLVSNITSYTHSFFLKPKRNTINSASSLVHASIS